LIDKRHILSFLTDHPVTQAMFGNFMIDGTICRLLPARRGLRAVDLPGCRSAADRTAPVVLTKINSSPASLHGSTAPPQARDSAPPRVRDLWATRVKIQGLPVSMAVTPKLTAMFFHIQNVKARQIEEYSSS
jgi:hypothetical protein